MSDDNITEEELIKIVNSKKCKSVKINGKNYYISKKVKDEAIKKNKEGGFAFLAAVPWAIGALASLGGVAAGVAKTVVNSREAQVQSLEKINKQKQGELIDLQKQEIIKKLSEGKQKTIKEESAQTPTTSEAKQTTTSGSGIYLNPYQGTAIHKYLKNIDPKFKLLTKKFKKGTHIIQHGKGIYLNPYKSGRSIIKHIAEIESDEETDDETDDETETEY